MRLRCDGGDLGESTGVPLPATPETKDLRSVTPGWLTRALVSALGVEHQIMHSQKSVEISVFSGISGKAFGFRQQLEASQQLLFKERTRFRLGGWGFAPGVIQGLIWPTRNRMSIPHFVRHVNKNQRQSVLSAVISGTVFHLGTSDERTRGWKPRAFMAGVTTCLGFAL